MMAMRNYARRFVATTNALRQLPRRVATTTCSTTFTRRVHTASTTPPPAAAFSLTELDKLLDAENGAPGVVDTYSYNNEDDAVVVDAAATTYSYETNEDDKVYHGLVRLPSPYVWTDADRDRGYVVEYDAGNSRELGIVHEPDLDVDAMPRWKVKTQHGDDDAYGKHSRSTVSIRRNLITYQFPFRLPAAYEQVDLADMQRTAMRMALLATPQRRKEMLAHFRGIGGPTGDALFSIEDAATFLFVVSDAPPPSPVTTDDAALSSPPPPPTRNQYVVSSPAELTPLHMYAAHRVLFGDEAFAPSSFSSSHYCRSVEEVNERRRQAQAMKNDVERLPRTWVPYCRAFG
jgi:hypothetical protein